MILNTKLLATIQPYLQKYINKNMFKKRGYGDEGDNGDGIEDSRIR